MPLTPEAEAREKIDGLLEKGWLGHSVLGE